MRDEILVFVSCPDSIAESIAKPLVEEKLAACVSILPGIKSIYKWKNELCQEAESLLLIKSNRANWDNLEERIKALHQYEIPEILAISIEAGHKHYLEWLNNNLIKARE